MGFRGVACAIGLAVAAPAAAQPGGTPVVGTDDSWTPSTMFDVGSRIGFESPPGVALVAEVGVGHRFTGPIVWHLAGMRALWAGRMGGGSSEVETHELWELRVGPSWWSCGGARCVGFALDGGIQRLVTHEHGGDVPPGTPPPDNTERDYLGVVDARVRYLAVSRSGRFAIEANAGFRFKARLYSTGHVNTNEAGGGGLLVGLGVGAAF